MDDTNNDYLFALQLQNDLIDLTVDFFDREDETVTAVNRGTSRCSGDVVDLTTTGFRGADRKLDSNPSPCYSGPVKRQRLDRAELTESVVDRSWETLDPNPDVHGLFLAFNRQYFWSALDAVTVKWSNRMTVCAGLCRYQGGACSISLSEPLLKLRPRKDLVETLLHEMIHAYLFLTRNQEHRDRDGHGPEFCKHMYRINVRAGTEISIYHSFHDEVRLYKQHWWKCNGPCQHNKPFYGYVKRSMNRAPGPYDKWWANHQAVCGGTFVKIKEPKGYGLKKKPAAVPTKSVKPVNKITNFINRLDYPKNNRPGDTITIDSESTVKIEQEVVTLDEPIIGDPETVDKTTLCPVCNESVLTDWLNDHLENNCSQLKEMFGDKTDDECKCPACNVMVIRSLMNEHLDTCKMLSSVFDVNYDDTVLVPDVANYVNCPSCNKMVRDSNINQHLDICLSDETPQEVPVPKSVEKQFQCPCCNAMFGSVLELDDHVDSCFFSS